MKAIIQALWVIGLLVVGVESFVHPGGFVGKPIYRGLTIVRGKKEIPRPPFVPPAEELYFNKPDYKPSHNDRRKATIEDMRVARDRDDPDAFVLHLKTLSDSKPPRLFDTVVSLTESMVYQISTKQLGLWMWCLGWLDFKAANSKHRKIVLKSVDKLCHECLPANDLAIFMKGLKNVDIKLFQLTDAQRDALMSNIDQTALSLGPSDLPSVLMTLSKMGGRWTTIANSTQEYIWQGFAEAVPRMTPRFAALAVKALSDLGVEASMLNTTQKATICSAAKIAIQKGSGDDVKWICQDTSMTLLGLAKMKMTYAMLPETFVFGVEDVLLHTLQYFDPQGVSTVLYALGLMSWPWADVSPGLELALQKEMIKIIPVVSAQGLSIALHGLAHMEVKWAELMPGLLKALEDELQKRLESALFYDYPHAAVQAASFIASLSHMKADFNALSPVLQHHVQDAFVILHQKFSPQGLANYIYGLSKMEALWAVLSKEFKASTVATFVKLHPKMIAQDLITFILGLGKLGAKWEDLSEAAQAAVVTTYIRLQQDMRQVDNVNIISGLNAMNAASDGFPDIIGKSLQRGHKDKVEPVVSVSWEEVPKETVETVLKESAPKLVGSDLASALHRLGTVGASLKDLALNTISTMASSLEGGAKTMSAEDVANGMYGLALLSCGRADESKMELVRGMFKTLIKQYRRHCNSKLPVDASRALSLSFQLLDVLSGGKELVAELGDRPTFPDDASFFQKQFGTVFASLLGPECQLSKEIGGMAVRYQDKVIAFVALDGLINGNTGSELVHEDVLKKYLHKRLYPSAMMHTVSDQQIAANPAVIAEEVATAILQTLGKQVTRVVMPVTKGALRKLRAIRRGKKK